MDTSKARESWRTVLTEQLRIILEQRPVRLCVVALLGVVASVFNLMRTPVAADSGWMFLIPVTVSAIAAGLREGLIVAVAASSLCAVFAAFSESGVGTTLAVSVFSARFALYGVTAVVLGSFAEAHHLVQSHLRDLATLDPLTKVANVEVFYREMGVLESQPSELVVMLVDLDELKKINDTYGHQVGTEAIRAVANVLRRVVRGSDLLARYGGDEFVLILRHADMVGAQLVVNRIKAMLTHEAIAGAPRLTLTVSAGVAVFGEDGKSCEELLEAADRRMYRDKQARKLAQRHNRGGIWGLSQSL
jgi:diguanylate cyclase (GGDEF)-like protein